MENITYLFDATEKSTNKRTLKIKVHTNKALEAVHKNLQKRFSEYDIDLDTVQILHELNDFDYNDYDFNFSE